MTSCSELWVWNWCFPSFMIVQWTSNAWGRRVRRDSFSPVQLISPKIIPPVEGGGDGYSTMFYTAGSTPRPKSLHIYRWRSSSCLFRVGASPYKFHCHSILCPIHSITITLTESGISLSTGCPSRLLAFAVDLWQVWDFSNTMRLVYYYCFRLKSMPMIA